jgi:hypothetical protein
MAARVNRTPTTPKPKAAAAAERPPAEDEVPQFTTKTAAPKENGARVVLFRLDGRDWTMTADRSFGAALKYLYGLRGGGLQSAQFALLEHCVGTEGVQALLSAADQDPAKWNSVVERAVKYVLGKPEEQEEDSGN